MGTDPFGRAVRDYFRDEQTEPLVQFDGPHRLEHPIEQFYAEPFSEDGDEAWIADRLSGPLLDVGAGAGRDTLYFQREFETVAIEVSDPLVSLMRERGVDDARHGDMFALPEQFEPDRFESVLVRGTQFGLAKSRQGIEQFLTDLATITTETATAVVDCYDPTDDRAENLLGYRPDATPGLAFRVFAFEYEGEVSETLLFRLVSPERLREAAAETAWTLSSLRPSSESAYYVAALEKE
jgi:SAM-dependent methyltransferase